jgi:hypothetical protein
MVQRNGVTRSRPAFLAGWSVNFDLQIQLPEYVNSTLLHKVLTDAGRLVGVGDFRPTYGRFMVDHFSV